VPPPRPSIEWGRDRTARRRDCSVQYWPAASSENG
jgi:hypothetical protein